MTSQTIKTLFASSIDRRIEEVIKVDQKDEDILRGEIDEYVVTNTIRAHYANVLEVFAETPNKPHEGIAVWVSGFFGSGKSSFAKLLGLSIENRPIAGVSAGKRFSERAGDKKLSVLLKTINEKIPTHAVIFDVSTDRGIRSGSQSLTEIMYGLFLHSLGYAKDLDLSELEITLEERGQLERFEKEYARLFKKEWAQEKGKVAFALSEASSVLHSLDPKTFPMADSWSKAAKSKADISPGKLAERAGELMKRRRAGHALMFVVDEVGQFVARDVQKMLDLQAIVQNFGVKGRGKHWLVVTSQEKLNEIVSGLDDKQIEIKRLMDRFPHQVHLEPSDISEVTSRRVLSKNAAAQRILGELYDANRGRLSEHTRLSADIKLPELSRDGFVELYPLLPYQIDLIINVVSGLRTQGGVSRHVGGANRTIIKLAQQLLINPAVNLASQPIGTLARLDHVYDLVQNNIGSDVRAKIAAIVRELDHPLAQPVAKVVCLLQHVKSVHRTAENIAAALHSNVTGDSRLAAVKEAIRELEKAGKVRLGEGGYRIPTPAEDDWERIRNGLSPRQGDAHRLCSEVLTSFWQPLPTHTLSDAKVFKAGLAVGGRSLADGDIMFNFQFVEDADAFEAACAALRTRSQQERSNVFWAVCLDEAIDREIVEVHRSKEMVARKEREAKTADETALIGEEKNRLRQHQDELRRLLKLACLNGTAAFRGNDRSPSDRAADVGKSATEILAAVLPEVFERFKEAAARANDVKKGLDALLVAENLQGLPAVFGALRLLREEKGKTVLRTDDGPSAEVLARIEERANYGETASGRFLAEAFAKEPFGWDFEVVRLLVAALLRAGKIQATSKGQTIESATGVDARDTFSNNNVFRQATFRPKKSIETASLIAAAEAFSDTFGTEIRGEITNVSAIVAELRREIVRRDDGVATAHGLLVANRLPGAAMLENAIAQMKEILRGSEENAVATFNAAHRSIKDAIKRATELEQALSDAQLQDLKHARRVLEGDWAFLRAELGVTEECQRQAAALADLLERETFYRELPAIAQHARAVESEYKRRHDVVLQSRVGAYRDAYEQLTKVPNWAMLNADQRRGLAAPFERWMQYDSPPAPIPQIQADREACDSRLRAAIAEMRRMTDGDRVVSLNLSVYFADGVETEEQLDAVLKGVREECAKLIGEGKKVVVI